MFMSNLTLEQELAAEISKAGGPKQYFAKALEDAAKEAAATAGATAAPATEVKTEVTTEAPVAPVTQEVVDETVGKALQKSFATDNLLALFKNAFSNTEMRTFFKDFITKDIDYADFPGGFSQRQSLSDIIQDMTRRKTPLWDMLDTEKVIDDIHYWDAESSLATGIASFAGAKDSVGVVADVYLTRYNETVRYYRTKTAVSQYTDAISRPQAKPQPLADNGAIRAIMHDIENDLYEGTQPSNTLRGLGQIIDNYAPAANSTPLGAALSSTVSIDTIIREITLNGGFASHVLMNPVDKNTFTKLFDTFVRYNDPNLRATNKFGYMVERYLSPFGEVEVMYDQFISAKTGSPAESTIYVVDIDTLKKGLVEVGGTAGFAVQTFGFTGPIIEKLVNIYCLLKYEAPFFLGKVTNVQ